MIKLLNEYEKEVNKIDINENQSIYEKYDQLNPFISIFDVIHKRINADNYKITNSQMTKIKKKITEIDLYTSKHKIKIYRGRDNFGYRLIV